MQKLLLALFFSGVVLTVHAQSAPSQQGLVLWLRADAGVTADASGVSAWNDQSTAGNHAGALSPDFGATGTEAPELVPNAINNLPAVRFDGVDDVLEIPNSSTLQPGEESWTVFIVARRVGRGTGDFPQIIGSRPWLAGLDKGWAVSLDADGLLASHYADDAAGHDVPTVRSSSALGETFEIWQVEENRPFGQTAFYRRGDADRVLTTAMPAAPIDQFNPVHIGREVGGANNRRANVEIAEILVYNRVLPKEERLNLTRYLADRYGLPFSLNSPPSTAIETPFPSATVTLPDTIRVSAVASDPDGQVARVEFYNGSSLLASASQAPYAFTLAPLSPATMNVTAVAIDDRGERATSGVVQITITGTVSDLNVKGGLQLWLRADAGVTTPDGGLRWEDQSGQGNHATQPDPAALPELLPNTAGGKAVLLFDGQEDYLEILNSPSLQPGSGDWTVFFVARRQPNSQGDFPQVIGSRPWVAGLDKGWAVSFDAGGAVSSHYADGASGHDVPATRASASLALDAFQVWGVEENRTAGQTAFYLNGGLNRSAVTPMPLGPIDQTDNIYIGREIGGANNRRANMELAEVLVYSRTLLPTERDAVASYLAARYGIAATGIRNDSPTVAITSPAAGAVVDLGSELTIQASASDTDGSISRVEILAGARVLGSFTNAPFSVKVSDLSAGPQVLTARATDNLGAISTSSAVTITNRAVNPPKPLNLLGTVDYSDSFTVGEAAPEPSETNPRPNGMYNNNSFGGYNVENAYGNPTAQWMPAGNFSFNTPGNTTGPRITQAAAGNEGAATGFAQSGGGDFNFAYGLRSNYVVQVDAILPLDRLDIGSYAAPGDAIAAAGSLTVFLRRDASPAPGIGLYNGARETAVTNAQGQPVRLGIDDQNWHRFSVHFNQVEKRLGVYVDGVLKASVDLATFADGAYANFANAAVGTGGAGFNNVHAQWMDNFAVGAPSLVGVVDYSDTFTVTTAPRRDGLYEDNSAGAYNIENAYGNPPVTWTPTGNFSFNTSSSTTGPGISQAATGNAGAETGLAQSGGGDFSIAYGLRENYTVSVDAILPVDRLDIGSYASPGAAIGTPNGLTVFFRRDAEGGALPGIGLYNGSTETAVTDASGTPVKTGISDTNWHNFTVHFDRPNNSLGFYVDGQRKAAVDLATFAQGAYQNYSNAAVGVGGAGFNGSHAQWFDNFSVGLPGPGVGVISAGAAPGPLAIRRTGAQLQFTWPGTAVLEESAEVDGTYTAVPNAASGHTITPSQPRRFYRLKQ